MINIVVTATKLLDNFINTKGGLKMIMHDKKIDKRSRRGKHKAAVSICENASRALQPVPHSSHVVLFVSVGRMVDNTLFFLNVYGRFFGYCFCPNSLLAFFTTIPA